MKKKDYQLGVGAVNVSEKSKSYVLDVLSTNRLSYGPYSRKFESAMAKAHDCVAAVFMNSGTSALQVAVMALRERYRWQNDDEIICPAITFVASSNVILQANLKPVFVDVHPLYYNIDPTKIEEAITPRTRAIMVVHLFGQPADMDSIMAIAHKHGLRVIEDSCETMFARYNGKSVGSFGDVGCFSTYACHIICTGVGGLAMTHDPEMGVLLRSIANHGRDSIYMSIDDDKTGDIEKLGMIMERRFNFIRMGYSYRATEMEAALGLAQIEDIEKNIPVRREFATYLLAKLAVWEKKEYIQLPVTMRNTDHSFMMFPIVVKSKAFKRDELTLFLEENNIETRYMLPLLNQPFYKEMYGEDIEEKFPVAKWINNNGFYIGCHPDLIQEELEYIVEKFEEFFAAFENRM